MKIIQLIRMGPVSLISLVLCAPQVAGFYVPGVAPIDFRKDETVEIRAVKMTSAKTQLPYEYFSPGVFEI